MSTDGGRLRFVGAGFVVVSRRRRCSRLAVAVTGVGGQAFCVAGRVHLCPTWSKRRWGPSVGVQALLRCRSGVTVDVEQPVAGSQVSGVQRCFGAGLRTVSTLEQAPVAGSRCRWVPALLSLQSRHGVDVGARAVAGHRVGGELCFRARSAYGGTTWSSAGGRVTGVGGAGVVVRSVRVRVDVGAIAGAGSSVGGAGRFALQICVKVRVGAAR